MEIAENCPEPIERALRSVCDGLAAEGCGRDALERGCATGRLVGALTEDAALATGALAYESLTGDALARPAVAALLGEEATRVAAELARLGEFGRGTAWNAQGRLQEPQAETLRKMLLAVVGDPRLVVARIAIQLARLRAARDAPPERREALASETRAVFAPLANRLGIWRVKWELEDLSFRYLEPEAYRRIAAALNEKRADRDRYIESMRATLGQALQTAGIEAEVQGRAKHIYSIHRKMQRKQLGFEQLFDLRALRIVCRSVPDCYAALGVVHALWHFIPGEFDDYIATPKGNHYRSIHTAVIGPQDRAVEVQIRTREMHESAEFGVAAHWRYKEGGARDAGYERKIEWVRRLLDPAEGAPASDQDFIDRVRSELFEDRVYALTPRGEVVDLPRGATPLDFAYYLHSSLGHRCRGAKVNGRIVPLTFRLHNGEIVEIITGKQEAPSRDWMAPDQGYLASARSRAKVRAWFRRQDAGDNEAAGRAIAERELARLGGSPALLSALVGELKVADAAQLHRALGEGEITSAQFAQAVQRRLAAVPRGGQGAGAAPATGGIPRPRRARAGANGGRREASPVVVEGVDDLPVTLARCCRPVRPQPIVGYVTQGRGVTVHTAECSGLRRMQSTHPDRVLRVEWTTATDDVAGLPIELTVLAYDRRGLVRDLSEAIAAQDVAIESLHTAAERRDGTSRTTTRLRVRDLGQMTRLLRQLGAVAGVISARRSA
ncbi:MAG: bifunctional (p)ppGpp synthetase/guanosine-3',5'-bis(diphosphate) 3'-pyrophosphohydrolase [Gammaproteobacteria bacterium]|nr:bifunctional (p)ppGpp synthetase/guanosine-3',5'-bis(diphosphate) 3'-pyrophosphohydrolase [Gammaproteobacteria bacterium]